MTKIEWTEATWNPIVGCSVVSPGCTNCYAMKLAPRLAANPKTPQYAGTVAPSRGGPVWTGKVALAEGALEAPLWRRKPTTYFVNSMGDLFHENIPDAWIDRVFAIMALCPQHTFQVLTKRAERMRDYVSRFGWVEDISGVKFVTRDGRKPGAHEGVMFGEISGWPLPNVWLGVSAEDQTRADERIPPLLATPAALRFLSAEPLLGPVDITPYLFIVTHEDEAQIACGCGDDPLPFRDPATTPAAEIATPRLDWVICGGESGRAARPMHPDWARALRYQCAAAQVPFFFKQWGEWLPGEFHAAPDVYFQDGRWMDANTLPDIDVEDDWREDWATDDFEGHCVFVRAGKKRSGRHLDGHLHDAMPARQ